MPDIKKKRLSDTFNQAQYQSTSGLALYGAKESKNSKIGSKNDNSNLSLSDITNLNPKNE